MKKLLPFLLLLTIGCSGYSNSGSGYAVNTVTTSPTWTQLTNLPSLVTSASNSQSIYNIDDGNIYIAVGVGSYPSQLNHIFVAAESCITTGGSCWTDITTSSLSGSGTEGSIHALGLMPNGTVLATASNGSTLADVWYWNGSLTSPTWTLVSGWTGSSTSFIYNFTNDQAGNTYFSPAYSGDVWRNSGSGSTKFSRILTGWYTVTGQPSGGIFAMHDYFMNGVEELCGGGEGELDCFNLASLSNTPTWNTYLKTADGCGGNLWGMDGDANTVIALRACDSSGDSINQINKSTLTTTLVTASKGGYLAYMDSNAVPTIHWMNGTTWAMGSSSNGSNWIRSSTDDGTTWDTFPAGYCPGGTLSFPNTSTVRIAATSHYVYVPCTISGNPAISQYGPM